MITQELKATEQIAEFFDDDWDLPLPSQELTSSEIMVVVDCDGLPTVPYIKSFGSIEDTNAFVAGAFA